MFGHKLALFLPALLFLAACGQGHPQGHPAPRSTVAKVPAHAASSRTAAAPFAVTLVTAPANPAQGDTIDIRASFTQKPQRLRLLVDGQAHPVFADGNNFRVLIGTDPSSPTGIHRVEVIAAGPNGKTVDQTTTFNLQGVSFPRRTITLTPQKSRLLSPAAGAEEVALAGAALAIRTPAQLWQGAFSLPLGNAPIDSPYGYWGVYNGTPEWFHEGVDFTAAAGTPVHAAAAGVVVLARHLPRGGNTVIINHGQGVFSEYLHLATFAVSANQAVAQGQTVGTVGSTGLTTGPGLHWAVFVNGIPVNPLLWVSAPPA